MAKYMFTTKLCREEFRANETRFNFNIGKPKYCPCCQMPQEPTNAGSKLWDRGNGEYYGTVLYTCNSCGKKYLAIYDLDTNERSGEFSMFYPTLSVSYENEQLEAVSPGFIRVYEQALRAEMTGDYDLAGMGYRKALECLLKDYAITELHKAPEEVEQKTLYSVIGEYYEKEIVLTADVVRILGNDYVHYKSKNPDVDFSVLKNYMEIFIKLIESKLIIAHPPVSR